MQPAKEGLFLLIPEEAVHEKTPVLESLFKKGVGLRPSTLLKRHTLAQVFSVNFRKFLKTTFLPNTSGKRVWLYLTNIVAFMSGLSFFQTSTGWVISTDLR